MLTVLQTLVNRGVFGTSLPVVPLTRAPYNPLGQTKALRREVSDVSADRQGGGRSGRWRVQHVDACGVTHDAEIVDERTVRRDGLRPDPGVAALDVFGANLRHEPLERFHERLLRQRPIDLIAPRLPVLPRHVPHAG